MLIIHLNSWEQKQTLKDLCPPTAAENDSKMVLFRKHGGGKLLGLLS